MKSIKKLLPLICLPTTVAIPSIVTSCTTNSTNGFTQVNVEILNKGNYVRSVPIKSINKLATTKIVEEAYFSDVKKNPNILVDDIFEGIQDYIFTHNFIIIGSWYIQSINKGDIGVKILNVDEQNKRVSFTINFDVEMYVDTYIQEMYHMFTFITEAKDSYTFNNIPFYLVNDNYTEALNRWFMVPKFFTINYDSEGHIDFEEPLKFDMWMMKNDYDWSFNIKRDWTNYFINDYGEKQSKYNDIKFDVNCSSNSITEEKIFSSASSILKYLFHTTNYLANIYLK